MSQGWINASKFSFNALLLMDTWIVRYISEKKNPEFNQKLAVALAANPAVCWYFGAKCPDRKEHFEVLAASAPVDFSLDYARQCEIYVLDALDTFIVYLYPEIMDELAYIKAWKPERLLSITDFTDKTVLDIGSGTGRLAIAVAPLARWVYACEPVDRLREYLRSKLERLDMSNVFVVDGAIEKLPFPDEAFDILVAGHVIGDNYDRECHEMERVTKSGGYIIACPGEGTEKRPDPDGEMLARGFECAHYLSKLGGDVYRYWKKKAL